MIEVPDFDAFYRAVNRGRQPFPWQSRLAESVSNAGWPAEIGIPTGLGKTACIDIAVWALASQAWRRPSERTAPTRIWYVVNRRLLVDAAYEHGAHLMTVLQKPERLRDKGAGEGDLGAVASVAAALNSVGGSLGSGPIEVTRLRGGAELGSRPSHPAQPSLIFATVPMFASRWLFRGYGCSASMRPVEAALAGTDSLVLLDEAHLAHALVNLAGPLSQCDVGEPQLLLNASRSRPLLVSLTATGVAESPFVLDSADMEHPVIQKRLDAVKRVRLAASKDKSLVNDVCSELAQHLDGRPPAAAAIFVNSPRTARAVFDLLSTKGTKLLGQAADLELLTGQIRDREGDAIRRRLLDPEYGAPAGRDRSVRARHLVVVATQTLEVGADLDFDVLVTEACGPRALVQRLGRLNRLGDVDDACGSLVIAADAKQFGIYGEEPRAVGAKLSAAAVGGVVELAPRHIARLVGPPDDIPLDTGELLPSHLWEWVKTTRPPSGEAPPELFFEGIEPATARVSVIWRVDIPEPGKRLVPGPSAQEAVDVPIWELRAFAGERNQPLLRLSADRVGLEGPVPSGEIRPGDQVILPSSVGGHDQFGWSASEHTEVLDLSLFRAPGIPLMSDAFRMLLGEGEHLDALLQLVAALKEPPEFEEDIDRTLLSKQLVHEMQMAGPSPSLLQEEWIGLISRVQPEVLYPVESRPRVAVKARKRDRSDPVLRSDLFDELSFTANSPLVGEHNGSVGELAARIAKGMGMPEAVTETLLLAGQFHDLGKVDVRFQMWLDPEGRSIAPTAKSSRTWQHWEADRLRSGWPKGGRHEELSRRIAEAWLRRVDSAHGIDHDLFLHLIASHHGQGRPLVRPVRDPFSTRVIAEVDGSQISVSGALSELDWEQPARFRRCCENYGYWGLALLEAVLRQADHAVSRVVVA